METTVLYSIFFRYLACLDLLGEKTEEVEELKSDIDEMKRAFHQQIQQLLTK
jgi:hypothetical protein